jgi:hypothetical protein
MTEKTQAIAHVFVDAYADTPTGVDLLAAISFKVNGKMKLAIHYHGDKESLWLKKMLEVADIISEVPDCSPEVQLRTLWAYGGVVIPRKFVCRSIFWHILSQHSEFLSHFTDSKGETQTVYGGVKGRAKMPTTVVKITDYQDYTDPEQLFAIWRAAKEEEVIPVLGYDASMAEYYDITTIERAYEYLCTYTLPLRNLIQRPELDITPVLPVKYDFPERVENLLVVIDYIHQVYRIPEVVVSEYGESPKLAAILCGMEGVRYCFTQGAQGEWNKSIAVNAGARLVKTSSLAIWDTDVLLPYASVYNSVRALETSHACIPYSTFINCHRSSIPIFRNKILSHPEIMQHYTVEAFFNKGRVAATAACVFIRTAFFHQIRGMSELFYGFGWEDVEFAGRLQALGKVITVAGPSYHLSHPRGKASKPDPETYKFNIQEAEDAHRRTKEETLAYMGITGEVAPYLTNPQVVTREDITISEGDYSQVVNKENFIQKLTIPHIH